MTGVKWEIYLAYLDDIIVFAKDWVSHLNHLHQVFQFIREAGLKLQPTKCVLGQTEAAFLGHLVSQHSIKPNPRLLTAIRDLSPPKAVNETNSFLILVSYNRRFMPGFA